MAQVKLCGAARADQSSNIRPDGAKRDRAIASVINHHIRAITCAGKHRGGTGLRRQIRAEGHTCRTFIHGSRRLSSPWGLFGGGGGGRCHFTYSQDADPPQKGYTFLKHGQSVTIVTPGAGGYGEPAQRDRALLERDIADGKVSLTEARRLYGYTG